MVGFVLEETLDVVAADAHLWCGVVWCGVV